MSTESARSLIEQLLQQAHITLNGDQPWDIRVHQDKFYSHVLREGALGLGESYMSKWWDCERLDILFDRISRAALETKIKRNLRIWLKIVISRLFNLQSKKHAFLVGEKHYSLGNILFQSMLDSRMIYSCGYWRNATTLEEAQLAKLELICQKLMLNPGIRLLDIGCGWGGLAKYAAKNYGVSVVGVTVSKEQASYAREYCKGLPIDIRLQDYRELHEPFDRVVSIGMFEHVGYRNYREYMRTAARCLKADDGIFLLHTIGNNKTLYSVNEWVAKYIFPTGMLPSIALVGKAIEGLFIMEDWHNFGADYDKTLMAWHHNFVEHWDDLKSHYDERFFRMWVYYLLSSAGSFRARDMQLWQIVLTKRGILGGYQASR